METGFLVVVIARSGPATTMKERREDVLAFSARRKSAFKGQRSSNRKIPDRRDTEY
jgi:hypothetical protein